MNITINKELRATIDPLTAKEYAALERSLLARQVREQVRSAKPITAPDAASQADNEVEVLHRKIAALSAENVALRQQVAAFSAALEAAKTTA